MADPVLKRLVDRGLPPGSPLQRVQDGDSVPGAGLPAARSMTGGAALDASTAGGLQPDTPAKYAGFPDPIRSLLREAADEGTATVQ